MKKRRNLWIVLAVLIAAVAGLYLLGLLFLENPTDIFKANFHIPSPKPEVILFFTLGRVEIPIANTVFSSFVAMVVLVILSALISRGLSRRGEEERLQNPRGWQNLVEWLMEFLIKLLEGAAGPGQIKKRPLGRTIFPLVATLFLFIIFANWFSLLPGFSTILVVPPEAAHAAAHAEDVAHAAEESHAAGAVLWLFGHGDGASAPLLRAPNSHLAITAGMAILAVFVVQGMAIVAHGPVGYLKHLATDAPVWMRFIMFPIHVVSEISRVISLSARLFGNLYGGDVLLAVIFNLLAPIVPAIFFGIEAFFYFIQALLFSVLTTVYISLAVAGGGHEEAHAH